MAPVNQEERRIQIETAAFGLLSLKGYKATSMLEVAKRAKASNETLYKWYGNKQGLFLSMLERNAEASRKAIEESLTNEAPLSEVLDGFGPLLLQTLTGQRTIVLTRAAAGDVHDTGTLGRTIAQAGRQTIVPLLAKVIERSGQTTFGHEEAAEVYLDLLVGDAQMQRVIGVAGVLSEKEAQRRSDRARTLFLKLIG